VQYFRSLCNVRASIGGSESMSSVNIHCSSISCLAAFVAEML
jgi:hypothetical protein